MISQVKSYYNQIQMTFNSTQAFLIHLEISPQMKCILAQQANIGRLVHRDERANIAIARPEKPFRQYEFMMEETVKVHETGDKDPFYTGVTFLQGDRVMLTDFNNKRVLLLNSTYQYLSRLTLQQQPWDICAVDQKVVAVSLPKLKTLQFLSVVNMTIKPSRTVQTRYECYGISEERAGTIVVSGNCNDKGRHYWGRLISSTGEMEKCHHFDCQCDPSETYVALNSSCTRIYVTIFKAKSLYCFDMNGSKMCVYSPDNLRNPRGVATDCDDNVYVAVGSIFDNIHQLTSYCTPFRIKTDCIPEVAHAISFNNARDKFVLTTFPDQSRTLFIYTFNS
ncbi:hypothetical protein ACJMK2_014705 [Sinanodonta woodiana]|uniref:Uncharacterized protein n=1 Tax=Sinanodonta woodiana TaxID=1069815 RepID=A0ABD3V1F9_SINWO